MIAAVRGVAIWQTARRRRAGALQNGMGRAVRWLLMLVVFAFVVAGVASAQSPAVTLIGRAVLPAESYTDGPASGAALANQKAVNGVGVPFGNQPVGSISAIIKGWFRNTWLILTDKGLNTTASADFLIRAYTVEVDWLRDNGSGGGGLTILDWITFADPRSFLGTLTGDPKTRQLTGGDLNPNSLVRMADGTLWMGDAKSSRLLHFNRKGALLEAPRNVSGGSLVAVGGYTDGSRLILALQNGGNVQIAVYAPSANAVQTSVAYPISGSNTVSDVTVINDSQVLVVEQDRVTGANAKEKDIVLFDLSNGNKTPLADLLNIGDPAKIATNAVFGNVSGKFGLVGPFKFPVDVSGVYPLDASTLVVINNNHFPFGTARQAGVADNTELILIRLNTALSLTVADNQE